MRPDSRRSTRRRRALTATIAALLVTAAAACAGPSPTNGALQVTTGRRHSCALLQSGNVVCWGQNMAAELGALPIPSFDTNATPVMVLGVSGALQIDSSASHTCAVTSGTVKCWGVNGGGQLGQGTRGQWALALDVVGISTARQVATGSAHSCALLADQTVKCWGYNAPILGEDEDHEGGVLGTGDYVSSNTPVTVPGLSGIRKIDAGVDSSCAILADGTAKC